MKNRMAGQIINQIPKQISKQTAKRRMKKNNILLIIFTVLCLMFSANLAFSKKPDTVIVPLQDKADTSQNISNDLKNSADPLKMQNINPAITTTAPAGHGSVAPPLQQLKVPDDIRDIAGPIFIPNPWLWLWYVVGGIILILVLWVIWLIWKKYSRKSTRRLELAHERAFRLIEEAKLLMIPEKANEYSTAVSNAMREYIETRFNMKSTNRTTHEFMVGLRKMKSKGVAKHTELLGKFLDNCDLAKFARFALSIKQMQDMHDNAFLFIDTTRTDVEQVANSDTTSDAIPVVMPDTVSDASFDVVSGASLDTASKPSFNTVSGTTLDTGQIANTVANKKGDRL